MNRKSMFFLGAITAALFLTADISASNAGAETATEQSAEQPGALMTEHPSFRVYLHTDKSRYLTGERVWFKAYGVLHPYNIPDSLSKQLNVALINQDGQYVHYSFFPLDHGTVYGDIRLPDSLQEGSYLLRGYTNLMAHLDDDLYFEKELQVINPIEKNFISRREMRQNRRFNSALESKQESYQFAVFPEGGHLVAGLENRVGFKAANMLGAGVEAQGTLVDDGGNKILDFETRHNGMGSFTFTPKKGMGYTATVQFNNGSEKVLALPAARAGAGLQVNRADDHLEISIRNSTGHHTGTPSENMSLLVHTRGVVQLSEEIRLVNGHYATTLPLRDLPDGITRICLLNEAQMPLAERLVFNYTHDAGNIRLVDTGQAGNGDIISNELVFDSGLPDQVDGSFSLAALASYNDDTTPRGDHIATYLLLTSELAGQVSDPAYYFSNTSNAVEAADLLMLTHGWRRFDRELLTEDDLPETDDEAKEGFTLSGTVKSLSRDHTFGNIPVTMRTTHERSNVYRTETDRQGNFSFSGLTYENMFMAEISIETMAPRRAYDIQLTPRELSKVDFPKGIYTLPRRVLSRGSDWSRTSRPGYVVETERRPRQKGPESHYGDPDQVIYLDDTSGRYSSMMDILRGQVRGLTISAGGVIMLRGPISYMSSNEPIFVVDGNSVSKGSFLGLRPDEVERIEVLSGSSAAIFGSRGAGGALIAYTKTTERPAPAFEFAVRGYGTPAEFYDSAISSATYRDEGVLKTVYWEPAIAPAQDGTITISMPDDIPDEHIIIVIEGIDLSGNLYFKEVALP